MARRAAALQHAGACRNTLMPALQHMMYYFKLPVRLRGTVTCEMKTWLSCTSSGSSGCGRSRFSFPASFVSSSAAGPGCSAANAQPLALASKNALRSSALSLDETELRFGLPASTSCQSIHAVLPDRWLPSASQRHAEAPIWHIDVRCLQRGPSMRSEGPPESNAAVLLAREPVQTNTPPDMLSP